MIVEIVVIVAIVVFAISLIKGYDRASILIDE